MYPFYLGLDLHLKRNPHLLTHVFKLPKTGLGMFDHKVKLNDAGWIEETNIMFALTPVNPDI